MTQNMVGEKYKRLPQSVLPVCYKIQLQPDLNVFIFKGEEVIDVQVKKKTKKIVLNCAEMQVLSVVFTKNLQDIEVSDIIYNADDELVIFKFMEFLPIGSAKLKIAFTGELNDKMRGFYRSKYITKTGEEKFCAVSQFEPADARRAFPCWDEPAIKATFDINIIAPKNKLVISNMDVAEKKELKHDSTLQLIQFNHTPIMSVYSVAFVIGEFDYIAGETPDGIPVHVYTPIGMTEQGRFALEITRKALPFYNDYFGVAYPLPKMDLISIPDFACGAQENWGLITYRETYLMVDPDESSFETKLWVALVVSHELAHQWFGNLTTMEWWTHLWLNEGFASFSEYMCVDYCHPDYSIWDHFLSNEFIKALQLDSLNSSHPIEVEVGHPSQIEEIFDAIAYSKGSSLIRMLHKYVGEEAFRKGLQTYLSEFQYSSTSTDDLWKHLEKASGKPVGVVMDTWTKQKGYPVVTVSSEQINSKRVLRISQKKFTADESTDLVNCIWNIPLDICVGGPGGEKEIATSLNEQEMVMYIENLTEHKWLKLNPGHIGFYRTHYSREMLSELLPVMSSLSVADRLGLENDLFALCMAGFENTTTFLNTLHLYAEETHYSVWKDLDNNLACLSMLLENTASYDGFKKFVIQLYLPIYSKIKWSVSEQSLEQNHTVPMLRSVILQRLGQYGYPDVVEKCKQMFQDHISVKKPIEADLRNVVYSVVAKHGNKEIFDQLLNIYKSTTQMEERCRIMESLGSNNDPELIEKSLNFALSDHVRSQDTVTAVAGCRKSKVGREMTWRFVKEHWTIFYNQFGGGFLLGKLVKLTTQNFATEEAVQDLQTFFKTHNIPSAERTIKQSIEIIQLNSQWLSRDANEVIHWLKEREKTFNS